MSVYKEPVDWLRQSIDSILSQTFHDYEFIIICDNPTYKEGIKLLNDYALDDKRIKILFNEENIGLTKSLNKGIRIASGEYIARMDADDIAYSTRLEKQINLLEKRRDVDVCGTWAIQFGDGHDLIRCPEKDEDMYPLLDNCFCHSSIIMRRRIAELGYNEECLAAQDFELWYRAKSILNAVYYNIPEPLIRYRCSETQITKKKLDIQQAVAFRVRRTSLDDYIRKKGLSFFLANNPVSLQFIRSVYSDLPMLKHNKQKLIYYLLSSTEYEKRSLLKYYLSSGLLSYMSFKYSARFIKGLLKGGLEKKY